MAWQIIKGLLDQSLYFRQTAKWLVNSCEMTLNDRSLTLLKNIEICER